jgi:hypothetical protein
MSLTHGSTSDNKLIPFLVDANGVVQVNLMSGLTVKDESGTPSYANTTVLILDKADYNILSSPGAGQVLVQASGVPKCLSINNAALGWYTNTETDVINIALATGVLANNDKLFFRIIGNYYNNTGVNRTITFRTYWDATLIAPCILTIAARATWYGMAVQSSTGWYTTPGNGMSVIQAQIGAVVGCEQGTVGGLATAGAHNLKITMQYDVGSATSYAYIIQREAYHMQAR